MKLIKKKSISNTDLNQRITLNSKFQKVNFISWQKAKYKKILLNHLIKGVVSKKFFLIFVLNSLALFYIKKKQSYYCSRSIEIFYILFIYTSTDDTLKTNPIFFNGVLIFRL